MATPLSVLLVYNNIYSKKILPQCSFNIVLVVTQVWQLKRKLPNRQIKIIFKCTTQVRSIYQRRSKQYPILYRKLCYWSFAFCLGSNKIVLSYCVKLNKLVWAVNAIVMTDVHHQLFLYHISPLVIFTI